MSRHVVKVVMGTVIALVIAVAIYSLGSPRSVSKAQDVAVGFAGLLQQLVDDEIAFVITFVTPVTEDRSYWMIPGDIEHEGSVIGRRFVREIGDNYICVDEIGQGATTAICVPFTNIAYINFTP